ncbi:MAG TPA: hypothetical protein VKV15_22090 [Bryobacteraceae bacterium]|nr:hypothetical protein [Bryobacteraceae bacterium]
MRERTDLGRTLKLLIALLPLAVVYAQDSANQTSQSSSGADRAGTPLSVSQKWRLFENETVSPLTLGAGVFNAMLSQATNSDPRYGEGYGPFAQRLGASVADIASQNFFGDFLLASVLHEDPRYVRMGPGHSFWSRFGYAVSRALVIRSDTGGNTFNWSNVAGTAMSAGLSNAYYPPASRTGGAMAIHFGTSVMGAGFANLFPEFWPDFRQWIRRHH